MATARETAGSRASTVRVSENRPAHASTRAHKGNERSFVVVLVKCEHMVATAVTLTAVVKFFEFSER
jgi:hypothetical protein